MLYDALIDTTGVQIFAAAGNEGPGLNTAGSPSVANRVVSVAASVSKATWRANYGAQVRDQQGIFAFSSRGPSESGGLKPTLAAPGCRDLDHAPMAPGRRRTGDRLRPPARVLDAQRHLDGRS